MLNYIIGSLTTLLSLLVGHILAKPWLDKHFNKPNTRNPGGDKYKLLVDLEYTTRTSSADEIRQTIRQLLQAQKKVS